MFIGVRCSDFVVNEKKRAKLRVLCQATKCCTKIIETLFPYVQQKDNELLTRTINREAKKRTRI